MLTLEITESLMMDDDPMTSETLKSVHALGVGLSMDDFGKGYSSLSALATRPLSELKIDRSFTNRIEHDRGTSAIVTAVIQIGRSLGMTVVAEGVETDRQFQLLKKLGCDVSQGYFSGRPMPPAASATGPGAQKALILPGNIKVLQPAQGPIRLTLANSTLCSGHKSGWISESNRASRLSATFCSPCPKRRAVPGFSLTVSLKESERRFRREVECPFPILACPTRFSRPLPLPATPSPPPSRNKRSPTCSRGVTCLGIAQTGTGKTAAFVLPMLTLLEKGRARARMPRTLILEPTRELAAQVKENFDKYGAGQKLNVALLIGGVSFGDQDAKLTRGVDVLIATPGRLLDHTERGGLLLTGVELLVIDEADRMLDMGFIPDIERICKLVPFTRQTLFFTATMPSEIRRITETFLHNPQKVEVSRPATTAATVNQLAVSAGREAHEKREMLRQLIRSAPDFKNAIIFCNRKREVAVLHKSLVKHGFGAVALHGDLDQPARMAALEQFRKGEMPLLVASDVAARGLDIPEVSHVFNFDVPHHPDDYVHRVGRTGRAGRSGTAISLVSPADEKSLTAIEKLTGQNIPRSKEHVEGRTRARRRAGRAARPRATRRTPRGVVKTPKQRRAGKALRAATGFATQRLPRPDHPRPSLPAPKSPAPKSSPPRSPASKPAPVTASAAMASSAKSPSRTPAARRPLRACRSFPPSRLPAAPGEGPRLRPERRLQAIGHYNCSPSDGGLRFPV